MYGYKKLKEETAGEIYTPLDDLLINGKSISELFEGYRQLHVDGRQVIPQRAEMSEIQGADGVWLDGITQPDREFRITFKVEVEDLADLRKFYRVLNDAFKTSELLELSFKDEPDWVYFGFFETGEFPPDTSREFTGVLTFRCPDPFAYKMSEAYDGEIKLTQSQEVLPFYMHILIQKDCNEIEISNGRNSIKFVDMSFKKGGFITIRYENDGVTATYEGRSILHYIALQSFPEYFYLRNGDKITVNNGVLMDIEWMEKRL